MLTTEAWSCASGLQRCARAAAMHPSATRPPHGSKHVCSAAARLVAAFDLHSARAPLPSCCLSTCGVPHARDALQECSRQPSDCLNIHYNSTIRGGGFLDVLEGYRRAWFCIQPMGDTPTRAALLDCLASGLVRCWHLAVGDAFTWRSAKQGKAPRKRFSSTHVEMFLLAANCSVTVSENHHITKGTQLLQVIQHAS